jgi:hypothetical protein
MVLDLMAQLDREHTERSKIETLLRELLDARHNRKSEQLSVEQLALFAAAWQARQAEAEASAKTDDSDDNDAAPAGGEVRRNVAVDGNRFRGISNGSASCTIWLRRTSTAPPVSGICGPSVTKPASATNTFPHS